MTIQDNDQQSSNPTIALIYHGKIQDRVGQTELAMAPDNSLDGVFTVTLNAGSGNRTVTRLQMTNSVGGIWNTVLGDGYWILGATSALGNPFYNNASNGSVNYLLTDGGSFKVIIPDYLNQLFLSGTVFTLTATFADGSTATASTTIAGGRIYYVAVNGDDNNLGTQAEPFRSLKQGVRVLNPGDTLLIREGEYKAGNELIMQGTTTLIPSGTASDPVTIKAYPGETVVWRTFLPASVSVGEQTFREAIHMPNAQECADLGLGPTPSECWGSDNIRYPYFPPAEAVLTLFTGNYITFDGIIFDARGIAGNAVAMTSTSHIRFLNSEFRYSIGSCISNPVGSDDPPPTQTEFINVKVHHCGLPYFSGRTNPAMRFFHGFYWQTGGNLVENSEIYSNGGSGVGHGGGNTNQSNNVVRGNRIYGHPIAGIYFSSQIGHEIHHNELWDNNGGIFLQPAGAHIYNNTIIDNTNPLSSRIIFVDGGGAATIENNILVGSGSNYGIWSDSLSPQTFRNNLIYNTVSQREIYWTATTPTVSGNLLGSNNPSYDARFVDPANHDDHLQPGSSALGNATDGGNIGAR